MIPAGPYRCSCNPSYGQSCGYCNGDQQDAGDAAGQLKSRIKVATRQHALQMRTDGDYRQARAVVEQSWTPWLTVEQIHERFDSEFGALPTESRRTA